MKKQIKLLAKFIPILFFITFTPLLTFAQGAVNSTNASDIITKISNLLGAVLPVLVALGVIYFVWGVVQYFIRDSEEAKEKGKDRIIYGIIGLAVIISIWGLVYIVTGTLGIGEESAPTNITNLVNTPTGSSACSLNPKLQGLMDYATCIIGKSVIPLIFAIATVMFIWGAVNFFIINANEEEKRAQGKQFMLWGIIALAVMISVWGLVKIVGGTFNLDTNFLPQVKP